MLSESTPLNIETRKQTDAENKSSWSTWKVVVGLLVVVGIAIIGALADNSRGGGMDKSNPTTEVAPDISGIFSSGVSQDVVGMTVTSPTVAGALGACTTPSFGIVAPGVGVTLTSSQLLVSSGAVGCVAALDKVFLHNAQSGAYQFNEVASVAPNDAATDLVTLTNALPAGGSFTALVRALYSTGDIVVAPGATPLTTNAYDGVNGGVIVLWSEGAVTVQRDIDVSMKGFRGGDVAANVGPESTSGRTVTGGGGGGGGCPGHGCGSTPGFFANQVGLGVDGGQNAAGHPTCVGGAGSPNGGGGGGSGYGYTNGNGGSATPPGGAGGAKTGNSGQPGQGATPPRGGGGGGGGSRDNGGGGGGGTPALSSPNLSNGNMLVFGSGSASGAGGGGGGGEGDYYCAHGGSGGYTLGKGGARGSDTCPNGNNAQAGSDGTNGAPGGGLIVIASNMLTLDVGVSLNAMGGNGGNGGAGGLGSLGTCPTGGKPGSGGGGGGADGATGGTIAYTAAAISGTNVSGGAGGAGGAGGPNPGAANGRTGGAGGNGGGGSTGASGVVVQIGAPPVFTTTTTRRPRPPMNRRSRSKSSSSD